MKEMRRKERQMDKEMAMDLLNRGEYGILSTVNKDYEPYGTPLSYVIKDNIIYFHCAEEGSKLDNIKINDKVCFTVVGQTNVLPDKFSTEYESVIVFGKAAFANEQEKVVALKEIIKKYSPNFINEGDEYIERAKEKTTVIRIEIENYTGKHRG